jgi:hypothetical protein
MQQSQLVLVDMGELVLQYIRQQIPLMDSLVVQQQQHYPHL